MYKVMMVGSAEKSGGGVSSVIKLMKKMPVWDKYSCYWLGTQIQRGFLWKAWYGMKAAVIAPFIMWRYDIIHFHITPGTSQKTQLFQLIFAKLYGKKVILQVHVGNQLNKNTENMLFKWWLSKADMIIFLAKRWETLFREKYGDITVPTTVLYNACEMIAVQPLEKRRKLIIMVGMLNDNKAPNLLLEAWSKIGTKYPDWKISFMGNGEVDRFKQMAIDLNLCDKVDFLGYVEGEAKQDKMCEASIFCLCSYEEGFPMAVLEAWSWGIPVISTPVGGLPDFIEEGRNCLTFPFGNSEKLAEQLERLIVDSTLRDYMSKYSRKFALEKFSLERINEDLDSIYRYVIYGK